VPIDRSQRSGNGCLCRNAKLAVKNIGWRGSSKSCHADKFTVLSYPPCPVSQDCGFDTDPGATAENR
jgi:hypothetical protein